jgi:hypothetical protein
MSSAAGTMIQQEYPRIIIALQGEDPIHVANQTAAPPATVTHHDESRPTVSNPTWWPTEHRRMPNFAAARYHPEWNELTGNNLFVDMFVVVLFAGCHVISVSAFNGSDISSWLIATKLADWLPRKFGFRKTPCTRPIAGEW